MQTISPWEYLKMFDVRIKLTTSATLFIQFVQWNVWINDLITVNSVTSGGNWVNWLDISVGTSFISHRGGNKIELCRRPLICKERAGVLNIVGFTNSVIHNFQNIDCGNHYGNSLLVTSFQPRQLCLNRHILQVIYFFISLKVLLKNPHQFWYSSFNVACLYYRIWETSLIALISI